MAQTGDGKNFDGAGGSKYPNLKAEFSKVPFTRGSSEWRAGDHRHRQLAVLHHVRRRLEPERQVHRVGEVVSGMDVVDKLKKAPRLERRRGDRSRQDGEGAGRIGRQVGPWWRGAANHRWFAAMLLTWHCKPAQQLDTIKDVVVRLHACWIPPPLSQANPMDITVIVSFNRDGNILGARGSPMNRNTQASATVCSTGSP